LARGRGVPSKRCLLDRVGPGREPRRKRPPVPRRARDGIGRFADGARATGRSCRGVRAPLPLPASSGPSRSRRRLRPRSHTRSQRRRPGGCVRMTSFATLRSVTRLRADLLLGRRGVVLLAADGALCFLFSILALTGSSIESLYYLTLAPALVLGMPLLSDLVA